MYQSYLYLTIKTVYLHPSLKKKKNLKKNIIMKESLEFRMPYILFPKDLIFFHIYPIASDAIQ